MKVWEDGTKMDMLGACQSLFFVTEEIIAAEKELKSTSGAIIEISAWVTKSSQSIKWREECLPPYTFAIAATEQPQNISVLCIFPQGWYLTEYNIWKQNM